jgi:hypothetical protein
MVAVVRRRLPWFIVFLQSASMVAVFCVTNVLIPTLRRAVNYKWENSHFLQPVAGRFLKLSVFLWEKKLVAPLIATPNADKYK